MRTRYHIITNHGELKQLVKSCKTTGYASYDFETNSKPIYTNDFKPTILSVSFMPGFGCSIPLDHPETENYCGTDWNWKKELKYFGDNIISNPNVTKVAQNAKFDNQIMEKYGIYYRGVLIDTMLAHYVLDENNLHGLKELVKKYLPEYGDYEKQDAFDKIPWDKKPLDKLCIYGCQDSDYTLRLGIFFEKKLIDKGFYPLYRNMIMAASRVLTSVEKNGLYLDREFNSKLLVEYKNKINAALEVCMGLPRVKKFSKAYSEDRVNKYIEELMDEINQLSPTDQKDKRKIANREQKISNIRSGIFITNKEKDLVRPLNLNSKNDLIQILYEHPMGFKLPILKYTMDKKTKRQTNTPSTDEETLVNLRLSIKKDDSPKAIFLDRLMELRGLEKMYKTYILGWSEKVQDDDCLHGRLNITGTESGRLSSSEPNIQQIPKTTVDPNIKNQLVARPGTLYLASDFSQAELRIMAHLSGDETYLKAFSDGVDPHLSIACKKYHEDYDTILKIFEDENNPDHTMWVIRRKQAKQLAFGLIYGIGPELLAGKLSDTKAGIIVSKDEAKKLMDEFFEEHPKLLTFKNKQEKYLRKNGFLKSLFGRKRRLPEIYSGDREQEAYALRLGLNFPVQSAASDMCLFGSILIFYLMRQGKLPRMQSVCLVHDANYMNTKPEFINVWSVYTMWNIYRNPSTKEYFGFQIDDVDMDMDFEVGRSMAEELPFVPLYDYRKMLELDFNLEEYMEEAKKYKHINIKDYPKYFSKEMEAYEKDFIKRLRYV